MHYTTFPHVHTLVTLPQKLSESQSMGEMVKHMKDQSTEWLSWKKNPTLERQAVTFKLQKETFNNKFNIYL